MSYSLEEIERKRQLAVQRKSEAQQKTSKPPQPSSGTSVRNFSSTFNSSWSNGNAQHKWRKSLVHEHIQQSPKSNSKKQTERFSPIKTNSFFGQKKHITGNCSMISEERFTLELSTFFPPLIETLKTIPSRSYDLKNKTWNFLLKDYEIVMERCINFNSEVLIKGLPTAVLQTFRKRIPSASELTQTDLSTIDSVLVRALMPFQREGICYGISKRGRCMIADDMGLGKTIQALGIAHYFISSWPLLIIAPTSVRYQWSDAIYKFLPSIPGHYVHQFASSSDLAGDGRVVITSYELLVRAVETFEHRVFGFVILDESHSLKDRKTARFKATERIVSQARHVILLSGTPVLSRPIELYSQIQLIAPNFMWLQDYGIRYCAGERSKFGWNFQGSSNLLELQLLLKHSYMIRRLKSEVLRQLPTKQREVVMLDPELIKAGTKEMEQASRNLERKALNAAGTHNALIQYYHESSFAKERAICDYVKKLFGNKRKFIVYGHHQNIMDAICMVAESLDIKYIRIDGKTNPERRKLQVDLFQTDDRYMAAVLSITAANAGITLTAAQLVVFAELFWNPGILCQAEDRVHRIGQDQSVVVQYLVAKKTADDHLWPLIQQKMNVLNEAGLDQDFTLHEAKVKKHSQNTSQQQTLNLFLSPSAEPPEEKGVNCTVEEIQELRDLSKENLDFGDWEDMA